MQVQRIKVADIMHSGAKAVDLHVRVGLVKSLFVSQDVRYLFVLDPSSEAVVGVVTEHEVLKLFHRSSEPKPVNVPQYVSEIMQPTQAFVMVSDSLSVAASTLRSQQLSVLPVLNDQHELCGALTENSVLSLGHPHFEPPRYQHFA